MGNEFEKKSNDQTDLSDLSCWKTAQALRGKIRDAQGKGFEKIARAIARTYDKESEWIVQKQNRFGHDTLLYHPDLINLLRERNVPSAGDWVSAASLKKELKKSSQSISSNAHRIALKYGKEVEWIEDRSFGDGGSNISEAYHPDLVQLLKKESAPVLGDWLSNAVLATELHLGSNKLKDTALSIAKKYDMVSTWIGDRRTGSRTAEAYHPDLVVLIRDFFIKVAGDWLSAGEFTKEFKTTKDTIHKNALKIATEHGKLAEWIEDRRIARHVVPHYHPDLGALLRATSPKPADDWVSAGVLQRKGIIKSDNDAIRKNALKIATEHGKLAEWIEDRSAMGRIVPHYHPDLVALLKAGSVKDAGDWMSAAFLEREGSLHSNRKGIHKIAEAIADEHGKLSDWIEDRSARGRIVPHYHPDLVALMKAGSVKDAGDWLSASGFTKELRINKDTVHKNALKIATEHGKLAEWIEDRKTAGHVVPHYHPDLGALLRATSPKPAGDWVSANKLKEDLHSTTATIHANALKIATEHGKLAEWIQIRRSKSHVIEHYHPDLVALLQLTNPKDAGDWKSVRVLSRQFHIPARKIQDKMIAIAKERGKLTEWVENRRARGNITLHFHPELISLLKHDLDFFIEVQRQESELRGKFVQFMNKVVSNDGIETKQFFVFIGIFGTSRALDILYKFRPEFKGLPTEYVRSCLAEYLGDFLAAKHEFNLKEIGSGVELLSDITMQEALYENIKADCLRYYFEQRKKGSHVRRYEIIYDYLVKMAEETHAIANQLLDDIIERVALYFNSALQDFHKPEKFVDSLSAGRDFPDINQQINMKEIKDKKRVLIADEMGLGKSASVIMAKEQLGVGCALVITPAGVQETWLDYLSDDPVRKGYFKPGQAPRVLLVENVEQLRGTKKADYDYVVISQEKLKGRYTPLLMALDPDMLIVDESHKIKKVEGTRAQQLLPLAKKMGADKYVALLSGTPIPNKVRDVAIVLKMLYPEQFAEMPTPQLVQSIIHGDIVNLRSLLIPRMQMKELGDVVEMPAREEKMIDVHLSPQETELYNAIVEMDELTAAEKMRALRSFLVNPAALEATPSVPCAKLSVLKARLHEALKTKSKILIIANDIVTGVMRGDNAVLTREGLGLPPDVAIEYIHGTDGTQSDTSLRPDLQRRFNYSREKMVLVMSGNAGGVGINLFGGEATHIYNEPWTISDLNQQKARLFRPGLDHDIVEETYLVRGSFEEGMHEYALRKHKVIEKVLKGIPISELEQQMLAKAERQKEGQEVDDVNFEENPELARVFLSWKTRLTQMFGHTKELGEEKFVHFLKTWGAEYAEGYRKVGARSYQANCNRVAGSIFGEMALHARQQPTALKILDVASGPEMLRRHIGNQFQQSVVSMDINPHHFENGTFGKTYVGSWTAMPFGARMFDYLNCAMAFQDSSFAPSRGNYERLNVLREMNRVLKPGGRAVISMIYSLRMKDMEKFKLFIGACGFRLVEDYTGNVAGRTKDPNSDPIFTSQILTLEKLVDVEKTAEQIVQDVGVDNVPGLKFEKLKSRPKNDRSIIETAIFEGGKGLLYIPNDTDRAVLNEQKEIEKMARDLREQFGTIKEIPATEIISHGFVRLLLGGRYQLFKQLKIAPGVMFIK